MHFCLIETVQVLLIKTREILHERERERKDVKTVANHDQLTGDESGSLRGHWQQSLDGAGAPTAAAVAQGAHCVCVCACVPACLSWDMEERPASSSSAPARSPADTSSDSNDSADQRESDGDSSRSTTDDQSAEEDEDCLLSYDPTPSHNPYPAPKWFSVPQLQAREIGLRVVGCTDN